MLLDHPGVREVSVIGYPDRRLGEKVCAVVVSATASPPTLAEIVAFLGEKRIAKQKLPERVEYVEELPKTATGKVEKFRLRELVIGS
jgi:non-ribosomal peptide synthetase component E (peptide arylation enzyme)